MPFMYVVVLNAHYVTCLNLKEASRLEVERQGFGQRRMGRGGKIRA
jgi:hypothetical protein